MIKVMIAGQKSVFESTSALAERLGSGSCQTAGAFRLGSVIIAMRTKHTEHFYIRCIVEFSDSRTEDCMRY